MYERHRTGGNQLPEDNIQGRRYGTAKRRAHPVTVKVDEDTLGAIRAEAKAARLTQSAVVRLALAEGLPRVTADRVARTVAK